MPGLVTPHHRRRCALQAAALAGIVVAVSTLPGVRPAAARAAAPPPPGAERVRSALAGAVVTAVDGRTLALDRLRGEVVVLNFWASWCAPCRRELPRLDAFASSSGARGVRVVAISIDQEARNVERFARERKIALPLYHDGPDRLARRLDLPQVPYTLVLDRDGALALAAGGASPATFDRITELTRRLAAAPAAGSPAIAGGTR